MAGVSPHIYYYVYLKKKDSSGSCLVSYFVTNTCAALDTRDLSLHLTHFIFLFAFIETLNEEDKVKMNKSKKKIRQKVQRGECQTPVQGQVRGISC